MSTPSAKINPEPRLKSRVAIITGAADGIGLAIAGRLARDGATVVMADIQAAKCEQEARTICEAGGNAVPISCDVASGADIERLVLNALSVSGRIDILINNAAVAIGGCITEMSDLDWQRVIDTNLASVFRACRSVIPHMLRQGNGAIINIGSTQGHVGFDGWTAYAAAKGGVMAMTRQLAKEFGSKNIRVNCVSPGAINTPMNLRRREKESGKPTELFQTWSHMHALERMGEADEVAAAVAFLASDEASFITGADLIVDGGMLVCPRLFE